MRHQAGQPCTEVSGTVKRQNSLAVLIMAYYGNRYPLAHAYRDRTYGQGLKLNLASTAAALLRCCAAALLSSYVLLISCHLALPALCMQRLAMGCRPDVHHATV